MSYTDQLSDLETVNRQALRHSEEIKQKIEELKGHLNEEFFLMKLTAVNHPVKLKTELCEVLDVSDSTLNRWGIKSGQMLNVVYFNIKFYHPEYEPAMREYIVELAEQKKITVPKMKLTA